MKVLHVVEPFSSGIITFIISLTEALPNHNHRVLHGCRVTEDKLESVRLRFPAYVKFAKWKFARRSLSPFFDFLALISLLFHIVINKYDVIHLHSAKAGFLGRIVGLVISGSKIIYTPNGAPFLRQDVSAFKRKVFLNLEKLAAKLSGRVICCGQSESEVYAKIGVKNIYINNGVKISQSVTHTIQSSGISITSVGILTFQKEPKMFNEIARHFKTDGKVSFSWIGGGDQRSEIDESIVEVTGWLDGKSVQELLAQCDIYLSTSLWEGQPFAVLEAMNKGKCLILRNCEGNRDLVKHGVNGYLFDSVEQAVSILRNLLENTQKIEIFGEASRAICIKSHDQLMMGKLYSDEYDKIYTKT